MTHITLISVLTVLMIGTTSCQSEEIPIAANSEVVDSITVNLMAEDSVRRMYEELHESFKVFLAENKDFNLFSSSSDTKFSYIDSLGSYASIYMTSSGFPGAWIKDESGVYTVDKVRDDFILSTQSVNGYKVDNDSLAIKTPEEFQRALLPFHVRMREARVAVLKLRVERREKLDKMIKSGS